MWERLSSSTLTAPWPVARHGIFGPTCCLGFEHNRHTFYSRDHFVEPNYLLGNILETPLVELVASEKQQKFGRDKIDTLPRTCRECANSSGSVTANAPRTVSSRLVRRRARTELISAPGIGAFFKHADTPTRFMADRAAPKPARHRKSCPSWPERKRTSKKIGPGRAKSTLPCGAGRRLRGHGK